MRAREIVSQNTRGETSYGFLMGTLRGSDRNSGIGETYRVSPHFRGKTGAFLNEANLSKWAMASVLTPLQWWCMQGASAMELCKVNPMTPMTLLSHFCS
jgi:hypothetical protein